MSTAFKIIKWTLISVFIFLAGIVWGIFAPIVWGALIAIVMSRSKKGITIGDVPDESPIPRKSDKVTKT